MPLSTGARLGPYEILTRIGAGGMGEVWKARDTRLDRIVAIKVSQGRFDERFEREARAAAALNHPNIVAIYDVGALPEGGTYLVQELVAGEPLRTLIGGDLPLRKALDLAGQIADGLAAAHQAGIVHRDLKPENVMVTREGRAKILDFGLARQLEAKSAGATKSDETPTESVTQPGTVLGTVGYMSPEQVRGYVVDARSDIFSFGLVLHEMLTGKRTFDRETGADTLSAILKEEPPELPEKVPGGLRQLTLHCLEKDPANRFQSAKDLAFAIHSMSGTAIGVPAPSARPKRRYPIALGAAGTVVAIAAAWFAGMQLSAPAIDYAKLHHHLMVSAVPTIVGPAWAPDGKSFVYSSLGQILLQGLDGNVAAPLLAREDPGRIACFFSPDGTRLYFTSSRSKRSVWSVGVAGGEPQLVLQDLGLFNLVDGAAISNDGRSLVVAVRAQGGAGLAISSPPGAAPQPLAGGPAFRGTPQRVRLRFSPDSKKLLAIFGALDGRPSEVWMMPWPPQAGKNARRLVFPLPMDKFNWNADWLRDSRHLVVAAPTRTHWGGQLWLADTESQRAWPLTPDGGGLLNPSVGPDGRVLYMQVAYGQDLVELPLDGSPPKDFLATDWEETAGAWSPSGEEYVYVGERGSRHGIWVASAKGFWQRSLVEDRDFTAEGRADFRSPVFSPDGQRIAYVASDQIWISQAGGGRPTPVGTEGGRSLLPAWSPDGRWIAFLHGNALKKVQVGSSNPPVTILERAAQAPPTWSPDGRWITTSLPGGIGVVSPDGAEKRLLVHRRFQAFGSCLGWSKDGSTLYLLETPGAEEGPSLSVAKRLSAISIASGAERLIAEYPAAPVLYGELYAYHSRLSISGDGKRLLTTRTSFFSSMWMMEGLEPPRSAWRRLWK